MRPKAHGGVWLAAILGVCGLVYAQVSQPGTGTVTGQVICADTQRPARFANVVLYEVPATMATSPGTNDPKQVQAFMNAQMSRTMLQTQTGIDGSFIALNVPPGDYYVMASVAGYVQPRYLIQAAYDAGEDVTRGVTGVPLIGVSSDHATQVGLTVSRGAAIEGHVLWDDGTPVSGAYVQVESTAATHKNLPPQFSMIGMGMGINNTLMFTDDRGRYRVSGLAPGEYRVGVTLQTNNHMAMVKGKMNINGMSQTMPLVVYAPESFRQKDAKPVTLSADDERGDEDITFNVNGTHTVSGRVTSAEDHHAISRAVVRLIDASDKTFTRGTGVDSDGNFILTFVPPGTYTLDVLGAADMVVETDETNHTPILQQKVTRAYDRAHQQVVVVDSDVAGQNFELQPVKPQNTGQNGN